MILLIKLIFTHLLGDFVFQSDSWIREKENLKLKSSKLYLHVGIHLLLNFLVIWNLSLWYIPVIIAVTHLAIDAWKLSFQNPQNKRLLFFLDQLFHFLVLLAVVVFVVSPELHWHIPSTLWVYLTGILFLTSPASIIIKTLIGIYRPNTEIESNESLNNAGKYIGILERLLVFVFIITGHWEGVGFLIAAKSIFRFSDLTQSKDRKLTEYILIGTLLSFGLAILTGLLCQIF